jgi:hypothetical protein
MKNNQDISDMLCDPSIFPSIVADADKNALLQEFYDATPYSLDINTPFNQATVEQVRLMYRAGIDLARQLHELTEPLVDDYVEELDAASEVDSAIEEARA